MQKSQPLEHCDRDDDQAVAVSHDNVDDGRR